jgi:hypothetical protein
VRSFINSTPHRYGEASRRVIASFHFHTEIINSWVSELSELGQCSDLLGIEFQSNRVPFNEDLSKKSCLNWRMSSNGATLARSGKVRTNLHDLLYALPC